MHDQRAIMAEILKQYALPKTGAHGVLHWARVMENGRKITESHGADLEVVELFALFHDSRRVNEYIDRDHGLRGGDFAFSLRGSLVHLDDERFELLHEACRLHTDGLTESNPTIQACWDSDRLDLGRVGIFPKEKRLCTDAARRLLQWAHRRATRHYAPVKVLQQWGVSI